MQESTSSKLIHKSYHRDLVSQSSANNAFTPAPITDAFGDIVGSMRETYDGNGLWGYRNEPFTGGLQKDGTEQIGKKLKL